MQKLIMSLIFIMLFSATAFAKEGKIYYNDEITQFQSYINENGEIYIPARLYEKLCNSEIIWNAENGEIVMLTPVYKYFANGDPRLDTIDFHIEFRASLDSPVVSEKWLDYVTGEPTMIARGVSPAPMIIKDGRAMIPLWLNALGEDTAQSFSIAPNNRIKISFTNADYYYFNTYADRDFNIYFYDVDRSSTVQEMYSYLQVDSDDWIWAGDNEYIKDGYFEYEYDEITKLYCTYLYMSFETASSKEIKYKFPIPDYFDCSEWVGFSSSEGISIMKNHSSYFFNKSEFLKFRDMLIHNLGSE